MPMDINELLAMNSQCRDLATSLKESLPTGLTCALMIFTEGRGPIAMAHFSDPRKMISVLEDMIEKIKGKGEAGGAGSPLIVV